MAFIRYNGRKKHEYFVVTNVKVEETDDIMEKVRCERRGKEVWRGREQWRAGIGRDKGAVV